MNPQPTNTTLQYGSVCSGIEAVSLAWQPQGIQAAWFSEIEPFPCAVLAHHYPDVPNLGDMTQIAKLVLNGQVVAPDILVGGERKSTRLNSSHYCASRMPSSA